MKGLKMITWSFLIGMTIGILMAISVKYPVTKATIHEAEKMCKSHLGIDRIKIGISGKMYTVRCLNQKVFNLK